MRIGGSVWNYAGRYRKRERRHETTNSFRRRAKKRKSERYSHALFVRRVGIYGSYVRIRWLTDDKRL